MIRFVVNGANRTGTHFLQSLLNNHPDVTCYWDIFWHKDNSPYGYATYLESVKQPSRFNIFKKTKILYDFLSDHYQKTDDAKAAGFLLKTCTASSNPAIIRWFRKSNVKVIHLVRENLLLQEVAKEIRRQEMISSHAREPTDVDKVQLNTNKLLSRLSREEKSLQKHRKVLSGTDSLEVKYEHLIHNKPDELVRIFNFIGVEAITDIESEFHKTEKESPREMIKNYDDVIIALSNTRFSCLLD